MCMCLLGNWCCEVRLLIVIDQESSTFWLRNMCLMLGASTVQSTVYRDGPWLVRTVSLKKNPASSVTKIICDNSPLIIYLLRDEELRRLLPNDEVERCYSHEQSSKHVAVHGHRHRVVPPFAFFCVRYRIYYNIFAGVLWEIKCWNVNLQVTVIRYDLQFGLPKMNFFWIRTYIA